MCLSPAVKRVGVNTEMLKSHTWPWSCRTQASSFKNSLWIHFCPSTHSLIRSTVTQRVVTLGPPPALLVQPAYCSKPTLFWSINVFLGSHRSGCGSRQVLHVLLIIGAHKGRKRRDLVFFRDSAPIIHSHGFISISVTPSHWLQQRRRGWGRRGWKYSHSNESQKRGDRIWRGAEKEEEEEEKLLGASASRPFIMILLIIIP